MTLWKVRSLQYCNLYRLVSPCTAHTYTLHYMHCGNRVNPCTSILAAVSWRISDDVTLGRFRVFSPPQWAASGRLWLHPSAASAPRSQQHTTYILMKFIWEKSLCLTHCSCISVKVAQVVFSYQLCFLLQVHNLGEKVRDLLLLSGSIVALFGQLLRQGRYLQVGIAWRD